MGMVCNRGLSQHDLHVDEFLNAVMKVAATTELGREFQIGVMFRGVGLQTMVIQVLSLRFDSV